MEDINRLKAVLAEQKRTSRWLANELGVTPSTVSKWCTNSSQPDLSSIVRIAELLAVDIKELIVAEYNKLYFRTDSLTINDRDITKKIEL